MVKFLLPGSLPGSSSSTVEREYRLTYPMTDNLTGVAEMLGRETKLEEILWNFSRLKGKNVSLSSKTLASTMISPERNPSIAATSKTSRSRTSGMRLKSGFSLMIEAQYFSKQKIRNAHLATSGCQLMQLFLRVRPFFIIS